MSANPLLRRLVDALRPAAVRGDQGLSISRLPSRPGSTRTERRSQPSPPIPRPPISPTPSRRWSARARCCARSAACSGTSRARDTKRGAAGDRARHVAQARRPSRRDLHERRAVRARRRADGRAATASTPSRSRVLDLIHKDFVRSGARLDPAQKERMAQIVQRLAALVAPNSARTCSPTRRTSCCSSATGDRRRPAGLAEGVGGAARRRSAGFVRLRDHAVALASSSRSLISRRGATCGRRLFNAWVARGENGGATDNRAIIAEIVALRAERAQLLGYETYADFKLDDTMAKTPEAVRELLDNVWASGRARAMRELAKCRRSRDARGRELQARRARLALLRRAPARAEVRRRRGGGRRPTSRSTT